VLEKKQSHAKNAISRENNVVAFDRPRLDVAPRAFMFFSPLLPLIFWVDESTRVAIVGPLDRNKNFLSSSYSLSLERRKDRGRLTARSLLSALEPNSRDRMHVFLSFL
jgi:hypothetical protein